MNRISFRREILQYLEEYCPEKYERGSYERHHQCCGFRH